ncbi:hypothetical protein PFLmoz3_03894 [Pseudomonas fluorescens]|uniref:Uncharacterized protein n=1 Tax=Pseudomonas fluorescens TaxID=294 RepID=A0A109LFE8_PSEFL|nr:hypothetical protein PFLmoz3_03894 [Pseudomonas fluorescens]
MQRLDLAVHQHQGHFLLQLQQLVEVMAQGVHDQAFDVVGAQRRQVLALLLVIAVGVAHHQAVAVLTAGGFDAVHHGDGIGVADIGHQHADQSRAATFQTTGHLVGAVAELFDGLLDAQRDRVGEQGAVIADKTRHAGFGHAGALGDVEHGDTGALGGGKRSHGRGPFLFEVGHGCFETGFRKHQVNQCVKRCCLGRARAVRRAERYTC